MNKIKGLSFVNNILFDPAEKFPSRETWSDELFENCSFTNSKFLIRRKDSKDKIRMFKNCNFYGEITMKWYGHFIDCNFYNKIKPEYLRHHSIKGRSLFCNKFFTDGGYIQGVFFYLSGRIKGTKTEDCLSFPAGHRKVNFCD